MKRRRINTKHRDKFGNVVFKPGDRCRYNGKTYDVIEGNSPEGSIRVRGSNGQVGSIGLNVDVKKLPRRKPAVAPEYHDDNCDLMQGVGDCDCWQR